MVWGHYYAEVVRTAIYRATCSYLRTPLCVLTHMRIKNTLYAYANVYEMPVCILAKH